MRKFAALATVLVSAFVFAAGFPSDYGRPGGTAAAGGPEALAQLGQLAPGEVEILLSYSITMGRVMFEEDANPFGHIAIRVGNTVYTANQGAVVGEDPSVFVVAPQVNYLLGVTKPTVHSLGGSNFGVMYARTTIGLRVQGLAANRLAAMQARIREIENGWSEGTLRFDWEHNNCATLTRLIAAAGGIPVPRNVSQSNMPLEVFDGLQKTLSARRDLRLTLVGYQRVPFSRNDYQHQQYPISLTRPVTGVTQIAGLLTGYRGRERNVHHWIVGSTTEPSVHYATAPLSLPNVMPVVTNHGAEWVWRWLRHLGH